MGNLLFWAKNPPSGLYLTFEQWLVFRDKIAWWILGCVVATAIIIVFIYLKSSRRKIIRKPADLFNTFSPLKWLWLAFVPAVFMAVIYILEFQSTFTLTHIPGAIVTGLFTLLYTLVFSYILICIPFTKITPLKFKYRPLGLFYRRLHLKGNK